MVCCVCEYGRGTFCMGVDLGVDLLGPGEAGLHQLSRGELLGRDARGQLHGAQPAQLRRAGRRDAQLARVELERVEAFVGSMVKNNNSSMMLQCIFATVTYQYTIC